VIYILLLVTIIKSLHAEEDFKKLIMILISSIVIATMKVTAINNMDEKLNQRRTTREGCFKFDISIDSDCEGRPWEMTFRYNGGSCSQSDNPQPRQKFNCTDNGEGAPRTEGTHSYITAVPRGGTDLYFAGPVAVGKKYTLNQDRFFDKLSADMTITIFDSEGGNVLQLADLPVLFPTIVPLR
jgi:hypothetical protein